MRKNIRNLVLLTGSAVAAIHLINRFIDTKAEMKNIIPDSNGNYFESKNGKIFYTKSGSGDPVVLIHDLNPVSSSYEWCRVIKKLQKDHTIYAIDLLGCGNSDKPYLTYTNYMYVQILSDFINDVVVEKPTIVSSGNSAAMSILAEHMNNGLIKDIIAINPPKATGFQKIQTRNSKIKKTVLEVPIIGTFIYNVLTCQKNIEETLRYKIFNNPELVSSRMIDAYYEKCHKNFSRGRYLMSSIEGNYIDNAVAHAIKKLDIPLYIIESRAVKNAVSTVGSYTSLNSKIETAYISNAGQLPHLEMPDKLISILNMFLAD